MNGRSSRNFWSFSSNKMLYLLPNRYFTEKSRCVPLYTPLPRADIIHKHKVSFVFLATIVIFT